jgi:hypothetical protein
VRDGFVEFLYLGKWSPSVVECLTLKGKKYPSLTLLYVIKSK